MRRSAPVVVTLCLATWLALAAGCDASLNSDIHVPAAATAQRGAVTVNGRVVVGRDAEVVGNLRTVNGSVSIGTGSRLRDLNSVNGSIEVGDRGQVGAVATVNGDIAVGRRVKLSGDLTTVNGRIQIDGGSVVEGDVRSVNGPLELRGATVHGSVANHAGDVRLLDGTLIEGDLRLAPPDQLGTTQDIVVIGVGAHVRGTLRAERPIRLFVHPSARIGRVEGVEPQLLEGTDVPSF